MTAARRVLITIGAVGMGYAVLGALTDVDVKPFGVLIFLAGVLVAHDAVLLPIVIGVGAVAGRFLPGNARTPVRVASVISLAVCRRGAAAGARVRQVRRQPVDPAPGLRHRTGRSPRGRLGRRVAGRRRAGTAGPPPAGGGTRGDTAGVVAMTSPAPVLPGTANIHPDPGG